ncbi:class I SAM-dependent methyltransferase [Cytobacillus firmus]|uniref:class I SAM-dependent methyltransferase n=1 Tax=Cytobacillus firmus TaxID=1399 RepID=UPI0018CEF71D|nr:class I SAM-dependent methyltransferase [Cytobacillus firmus]MBG9588633.1 family 2 glycosyl transferase [Cytobacillus firmus]
MKRFWDDIIQPILFEGNVKSIIEIGSEVGINTVKILKYCSENNAKLISIDPSPQFDADNLENEIDYFKMIKDFSLNALPEICDYDAVLIDGDHNWYTVYHELKLIEKTALKKGRFPITFLHDTDWPYGRRDMYYFPDTIPVEFRKKFAKKGMLPGYKSLIDAESDLDKKSKNKNLNNSLFESGDKNGVLTAVEDFMKEASLDLSFYNITSNNGLGILIQKDEKMDLFIQFAIQKFNNSL